MASPLDMKYGQMSEFIRVLIAAGLDDEAVKAILRSPETANAWVEQLRILAAPLFVSPKQQIQNAWKWWGDYFLHVNQLQDAERQIAQLKPSEEPLVAWVLVPHFNTIQQTFDFLWQQATSVHPDSWRSPVLKSDAGHMRLLDGIEFNPNCFTWELIDFGAHVNGRPDIVRGGDSAEFALLAAACQHPHWAISQGKTINGIFVPYVNLCGLQFRRSDSGRWAVVPCLRHDDTGLRLFAYRADLTDSSWACPVRLASGSS